MQKSGSSTLLKYSIACDSMFDQPAFFFSIRTWILFCNFCLIMFTWKFSLSNNEHGGILGPIQIWFSLLVIGGSTQEHWSKILKHTLRNHACKIIHIAKASVIKTFEGCSIRVFCLKLYFIVIDRAGISCNRQFKHGK